MDKETAIETVLIIAFFTAILFLGPAAASEHRLKHDYPVGYAASDAFQHQSRAEGIKGMGQYRYEAPYMMFGLTDVIGFYPPVLYHVTVLLSHVSGLETYDALFLIVGFALALGALVAYHLTKSLGKSVAVLALPLAIFTTTGKPFLGMATFGQMPFVLSSLFLITTAWAITKLSLPRSYLLVAAFLTGTIMTHTSETLFLAMIMATAFALITALKVAKEKMSTVKNVFKENRKLLIAFAIASAATLYFWPMFMGIWPKLQPYRFNVERISASFPAASFFFKDFGFMQFLIIAGLIAAALFAVQKRKELETLLNSPKLFTLAFSAYMLLAGLGNYFGFGLRSFQTRLFWPITLAPLAGFGAYQLTKIACTASGRVMKLKGFNLFAVAVVVAAVLSTAITATYYNPPSKGSMNINHWEAMKWLSENAPKDARVYVPYSHVYSQTSVLYNTERVSYFLGLETFIDMIRQLVSQGRFNKTMIVTTAADTGAGLPYRTGLLSFDQHTKHVSAEGARIDICTVDYYLIDKSMPEQALSQANMFLLQRFLASNMTVEYDNPYVTVLRNTEANKAGGDCIGLS
ncbi:hypothetical protein HYV83_00325 [Candidatus Woesearchaeota archaeon]|nr:hypothetical protein [Candidatus Woesearchaeota archaeon]